jgi:hypothetical protein
MNRTLLSLFVLVAACSSAPRPVPSGPVEPSEPLLDPHAIAERMTEAADRQLARTAPEDAWKQAVFQAALIELGELTGNPRYQAAVRAAGEAKGWAAPGALAYLGLFERDRDRRMARPALEAFDALCAATPKKPAASAPEQASILAALALATETTGRVRYRDCALQLGWPKVDDSAGSARALLTSALLARAVALGVKHAPLPAGDARARWLALARGPRPEGAEASAAFLLAGSEAYRLVLLEGSRAATVMLGNPLEQPRFVETAELPWPPLARLLGAVPGDPIVVIDARTGRILLSQLLDEDGDSMAEKLLVSVSLLASERRPLEVRRLARPYRPELPAIRAYGRFVPEAHDDFAWENDRVAFRVYGPAIERQHMSSGIDVWAKRIRDPVIDRWYQHEDYHHDRGEGLDFYRVGPSRGCGGLGLWNGQHLDTSRNFKRSRLVAGGPVRVAFELDYDAWGPAGALVTETKRISLDLGQNLSRIESRFAVVGAPRPLPVAVGVVRRGEGTVARDEPTTWLSYVEPPQGSSGQIGCGVLGLETATFVESGEHYLLVHQQASDRPFVYYAGAYWSKAPDFRQPDEWSVYLAGFSRRAGAPITVELP